LQPRRVIPTPSTNRETRHQVHSTQQPIHNTIGTAASQLNCATHTAILLRRPTKAIHLSRLTTTKPNNNNTLQQSRVLPPTTSTRYKNASSSAFYTATHTRYNRNCTISTELRHSHSHLTPTTTKGPYTCHESRRQDPTTTTHCNRIVPIQQHQQVAIRVIKCILHNNPYTIQSELQYFNPTAPLTQPSYSVDQQRPYTCPD
jgi:hypothetical protein